MHNLRSPRIIISFLLGAFLFGSHFVVGFTEPTSTPPLDNTPAPLNTGSTGQSKAGGLILNTGGAANGLIVQSGNVGIGTLSPGYNLDVIGYIRGSSGLCIGNDCRTVWPSSTSYSAGSGISISGTTISNTGVISESDPTVQSWAKTSSPSIPGSVNIGGTIRGASYGFGGLYATGEYGGYPGLCVAPNALTGSCSCPTGFSDSGVLAGGNSDGMHFCYR